MVKKKESLDYRGLVTRLRRDGPMRLYMLWGEEDYLTESFARELRRACLGEGDADFDLKRLDGPALDVSELAEALDAMPFFGERTLVELRGVAVNDCKDERFAELLGDIPPWCTVVLTLPAGVSPDGRLKLVKQLKAQGVALEFTPQPEAELYIWLKRRFAAHGKSIGRAEMDRLLFLSGDLMNRLIPEIEKICAYAAGEEITLADVDAVAHHLPEADVFEMTDALAAGKLDRAAALLGELLAGDAAPIMLVAVIGAQFRKLYAARVSLDEGLEPRWLQEVTGSSAYFVPKLRQTARAFSAEELRRDVRLCARTDYLLKSDQSATDAERIEELLVRLAMNREYAAR